MSDRSFVTVYEVTQIMVASSPKISIGMPVYNAERYLAAALDSLLIQTFEDFEVIISDNASDDSTESICREYAELDSRIRYHRHSENRGAIWNCNHAIDLATGQYFKWAAYDDVHHETFLQKCTELLDTHGDITWCHSKTVHIDANGEIVQPSDDMNLLPGRNSHSMLETGSGLPASTRNSTLASERFAGVLLGTTWCADSFGLFRIEALRQTRLLLPCYGSEKVLLGELSLLGRYAEIPEVLFYERIHGEASASLRTEADQQKFVMGTQRQRPTSTRLQLLMGHVGTITRSRLSFAEKARCTAVLLRYVCQFRKWKRILSQSILRQAVGAERRTRHETEERPESTREMNPQLKQRQPV